MATDTASSLVIPDSRLANGATEILREHSTELLIDRYAHKPQTAYGTVNAVFCERYLPGFKSPDACDLIAASPLQDSQ